jgi:hypothetical protein
MLGKPDDIPQDIWDAASAVVGPPDGLGYAKVFTVGVARALAAERVRSKKHIAFLIKQRTEAMENTYCRCEAPMIRCDDSGCRCELCGGLER